MPGPALWLRPEYLPQSRSAIPVWQYEQSAGYPTDGPSRHKFLQTPAHPWHPRQGRKPSLWERPPIPPEPKSDRHDG